MLDEKRKQIERNFTYHSPDSNAIVRMQAIREKCKELAFLILDSTPMSREQSLALTHLEDTSMWANAAIARQK